jgi:hypothetical protein
MAAVVIATQPAALSTARWKRFANRFPENFSTSSEVLDSCSMVFS